MCCAKEKGVFIAILFDWKKNSICLIDGYRTSETTPLSSAFKRLTRLSYDINYSGGVI